MQRSRPAGGQAHQDFLEAIWLDIRVQTAQRTSPSHPAIVCVTGGELTPIPEAENVRDGGHAV